MDPDPATTATTTTSSFAGDDDHQPRRRICEKGCQRPINVCLCHTIPEKPIPTLTKVIILHHPHEQRHKLATVPVLSKCLQNCEVIVGRKLRYGDSKTLDSLYDHSVQNPNLPLRAIHLFPGKEALPLTEIDHWKSSTGNFDVNDCALIAFDGTWKHAKEMLQASLLFLSKFSIQASLNYDAGTDGGTIFDSDLTLRKEPFGGCMSTIEAVARCLRLLEPNGIRIESSLIEVLREMVKFQASFLKPMKPRPKLSRKDEADTRKMLVNFQPEHLKL